MAPKPEFEQQLGGLAGLDRVSTDVQDTEADIATEIMDLRFPQDARPRRCHLAYLTANDSAQYQADFLNFRHMTRHHPGVDRVTLCIAISRVHPFTPRDHRAIDGLLSLAAACSWLDSKVVLWKGNVGRDFSSAEACLNEIGADARPDDYVMVRNRSAYGPARDDWYRTYIAQYERFEHTGLVGSTINFRGHPQRPTTGLTTHVQTYAYLSQWRHFAPLVKAFPAARCVDRLQLINEGEIGLTQAMFERGLGVSCLNWPEEFFTRERPTAPHLPQHDVKARARTLSLRYKYPQFLRRPSNLWAQTKWWLELQRRRTPSAAHQVPQRTLDQYD